MPLLEYKRRFVEVERIAQIYGLPLVADEEISTGQYLSLVLNRPHEIHRCDLCAGFRIERVACAARDRGFRSFTTTMLYSRHLRHDEIRRMCELTAKKYGVEFLYTDFRKFWNKGIELSKKYRLYRQQYCGCIFSEGERFENCWKENLWK
jgi:epoxyqueuosine reductase